MSNRFDYVKYDAQAEVKQKLFKALFQNLENCVLELKVTRAQALALTALEVAYMWIGKALRDDQIKRNGKAELMEGRKDDQT